MTFSEKLTAILTELQAALDESPGLKLDGKLLDMAVVATAIRCRELWRDDHAH